MNDIRLSFEYAFKDSKPYLSYGQISNLLLWDEINECYQNGDTETSYYWFYKGYILGERG